MIINNLTDIPHAMIEFAIRMNSDIIKEGIEINEIKLYNKKERKIFGNWGYYYPHAKLITLRVPRILTYVNAKLRVSKAKIVMHSRAEFVVSVLAHEMRHAYQYQVEQLQRKYNEPILSYIMEVEAESYQLKKLREFREMIQPAQRAAQNIIGEEK